MKNIQQLISNGAEQFGTAPAITYRDQSLTYAQLADDVAQVAAGLKNLAEDGDRIAVYLPKLPETVISSFACFAAGMVLVPVNPVLKEPQLLHILRDSGATILVTQASRLRQIPELKAKLPTLKHIFVVDDSDDFQPWASLKTGSKLPATDYDQNKLCALLYTSGSTGAAKGVMLSHQNLMLGTQSVAQYLALNANDKILAALPFSFDYGFNQLLSALLVGAECVLIDYLLPRDIPNACAKHQITGLAGVPPLWRQLADIDWPAEAAAKLRYFTNSGGHMPQELLAKLRLTLPKAQPFLMYGLTEAFRSSYLPPSKLDEKPDSMGVAIPGANLYVLNKADQLCKPGEVGELVHAGPLVGLGYWKQPTKTAERFKTLPSWLDKAQPPAVWSGDRVYADADGYLFFKGRVDEQIKVSGYRISPEEVEQQLLQSHLFKELAVFGVPDDKTGQAIALVFVAAAEFDDKSLLLYSRQNMPAYMTPSITQQCDALPRNPNGKIDRNLTRELLNK